MSNKNAGLFYIRENEEVGFYKTKKLAEFAYTEVTGNYVEEDKLEVLQVPARMNQVMFNFAIGYTTLVFDRQDEVIAFVDYANEHNVTMQEIDYINCEVTVDCDSKRVLLLIANVMK